MRLNRILLTVPVVVMATVAGGVVPLDAPVASAQSGGSFRGSASVEGLRVYEEVKDFLVVERFVDSGAPVVQSTVSSLESVGFASAPYPGDTAVSAPGLISGTAGVPVPDYPLVAQSQHPSRPEARVDQGGVRLSAGSTQSSSTASGAAGGPDDPDASAGSTRASAEVVHDPDTGRVESTATSTTEAFGVEGLLRIGRIHSSATVVDGPDGDPKRASDLSVSEMTVVGQSVRLGPEGISVAGSSTPLPDTSPLLQVLSDQGIEVRYLAAEETADGVIAPGVEVRVRHPVPGSPTPGHLVYRLGRSMAEAVGGSDGGGIGSTGARLRPTAGVGADSADSGEPLPSPSGGTAVDRAVGEPSSTTNPETGAEEERAAANVGQTPTVPVSVAQPQWDKAISLGFYLVIVLAGAAALGGSQLIRLVAVRMPWSS